MNIPTNMTGVYPTDYGGLDKLDYRSDIPVPKPNPGQVLVNVTAAGINNTDIKTRTGWYNQSIDLGTTIEGGSSGFGVARNGMGEWSKDFKFLRIQGADVVVRIVAVREDIDNARIGERMICDPYIRDPNDDEGLESAGFLGADLDGGFAQFAVVPSEAEAW